MKNRLELTYKGDGFKFLDGGTKTYTDIKTGNEYFLYERLQSKTRGMLYAEYPKKTSAPLDSGSYTLYDDGINKSAECVSTTTLVGYIYKNNTFPYKRGNCFSVECEGISYNVVNCVHENLEHLIETGVVEFPIKIKVIGYKTAIITDERFPSEVLFEKYCSICCPKHLQPRKQQDEYQERIDSGEIRVVKCNGFELHSIAIKAEPKKLKAIWSYEQPI
jgi:hypothetical protein